MLGLGLESTTFPRPLHIFDNLYSLRMDGVGDGIKITRDNSMIGDSFTYGIWVGAGEHMYSHDITSTVFALIGNQDASGSALQVVNKRLIAKVFVQDQSNPSDYQVIQLQTKFNRLWYAAGAPLGHPENYSTAQDGWNLFVMSFHLDTLKLYVGGGIDNGGDGMGNDLHLVDSITASAGYQGVSYDAKAHSDNVPFGIGIAFRNSNEVPVDASFCDIDNAFYFNTNLNEGVLRTIYNNGAGIDMLAEKAAITNGESYTSAMINDNLKMHLRMTEGSGTTLDDVSGNSNNGQIIGDPDWVSNVPLEITN
tara:strand:- start:2160 stop:3083 length:924 start_codon:yes stop_codon:yes gene_type:complete